MFKMAIRAIESVLNGNSIANTLGKSLTKQYIEHIESIVICGRWSRNLYFGTS
jgi:hypothetical protein